MKRLDLLLTEKGLSESRTRAQELIKSGAVKVNGSVIVKPSYLTEEEDDIEVSTEGLCPYVSRGGLKLEAALKEFNVSPKGLICLDIGASTGGFTDCLLKNGASKVYAVDSGSSQLHPSLLADSRVISLENRNARYLSNDDIPEKADLTVMDVSFISQTKLYPSLIGFLKEGGALISLIKPQFEVGRSGIGKGGIVKDEKKRMQAVDDVIASASAYGLSIKKLITSPIKGGDGNIEFLAHFIYEES